MTPPAWRWTYLLTRIAFALLLISVPAARILSSPSDSADRAFSSSVAGIAAIAVVVIVAAGLLTRLDANVTVRKVWVALAAQHPDGGGLVQKTSRMQSDLKSLKPDLYQDVGAGEWRAELACTPELDIRSCGETPLWS